MSSICLIGKHIVNPKILCPETVKSLLWTAYDLKYKFDYDCSKQFLRCIKGARVTVLFESNNMFHQSLINSACNLFNLNHNIIVDRNWRKLPIDTGRFLSIHSDVILIQSKKQNDVEKFIKRAKVPIINIKTCRYCIPNVLSNLMVIHKHFGRLEELTLSTIGVPCALLSTYLCILPRLKMNIKYMCSQCEGTMVSPYGLDTAKGYCNITRAKLTECHEFKDVIKESHVITITKADFDIKFNKDEFKCANNDYIILPLVSEKCCDGNELLEDKNCKIWKSFEYGQWIYAALILRVLTNYEHIINKPNF